MRRFFLFILFLLVYAVTVCHAQTIVRYQYWLDNDHSHETITELTSPGSPVQIKWSMDVSDVSEGLHTLYYRAQDSDGEWSVLYAKQFFRARLIGDDPIVVTGMEYWVDTEKSHFTSLTVSGASTSFTLDAGDMTEGLHTLYYRVKDNKGMWGALQVWPFFVTRLVTNSPIEATDIEYWIDAGKKHYDTKPVSEGKVAFSMELEDLSEGLHTLYYRVKDNEGMWSVLYSWQFFRARIMDDEPIAVTGMEYWVDTQKAHFTKLSVSGTTTSFTLAASDMTEGLHTLYYRVKDNQGMWGALQVWPFFVTRLVTNSPIAATDIEYWIDAGKKHYDTKPVSEGKVAFSMELADLSEGLHTLYYRVKDNEGMWSVLYSWQFFRVRLMNDDPIAVTGMEYWVDTEKTHFTSLSVSGETAAFTLAASDMTEGLHTLYYRVKDNQGMWGALQVWPFFVTRLVTNSPIEATDIEYWIDAGKKHYDTKPVSEGKVAFSMELEDLSEGLHTLYYRVKDNEGMWSVLYSWHFFVTRLMKNETIKVTQCEYWVDEVNDQKMVVPVTENPVVLTISVKKSGNHTLYYRFKDNEGGYSPLYLFDFIKVNPYGEVMILPIDLEELDDDMKDANPDYMAYPTEIEDQIERDVHIQCDPPKEGFGPFSISATNQVVFAPGNLQYNAAKGTHHCADGTTQPGTWRFAENQWNLVGDAYSGDVYYNEVKSNNESVASNYAGWIDLFGWGTSGWNSGANTYQPYSTSNVKEDYYLGGNMSNSMTGDYAYADWGLYNDIVNQDVTYPAGTWRTLTNAEWTYIFEKRPNASKLCGQAKVNGVAGYILLPDDWSAPEGITFVGGKDQYYTKNVYTLEQWLIMENRGAVFLPASGVRVNTSVGHIADYGTYWSSSAAGEFSACGLSFCGSASSTGSTNYGYSMRFRYQCVCVRLVKDIK